eukprot:scaffold12177_cov114-Isochrysis_galbana.AAC.2
MGAGCAWGVTTGGDRSTGGCQESPQARSGWPSLGRAHPPVPRVSCCMERGERAGMYWWRKLTQCTRNCNRPAPSETAFDLFNNQS